MNVQIAPPINPSHVFFGDNLISGVFPMKNPKMYAKISFETTQSAGKMNQNNPLYILYTNDQA